MTVGAVSPKVLEQQCPYRAFDGRSDRVYWDSSPALPGSVWAHTARHHLISRQKGQRSRATVFRSHQQKRRRKMVIYLLFIVSCGLCYLVYTYKKDLETRVAPSVIACAVTTNTFEFLVPFTAVSFLYSVLSYSLNDIGSDHVTMKSLVNYENTIQRIDRDLAAIRPSPVISFLLVVLWFVTAMIVRICLNTNVGERLHKAYVHYETFDKWLRASSSVVLLLASFTFFSGPLDQLHGELQAHIKTVKENYNGFANQVKRAVELTTLEEIYNAIDSSAPPEYVRLKTIASQGWESYTGTARTYSSTKTSYKYSSPRFAALEDKTEQRQQRVATVLNTTEALLGQAQQEEPINLTEISRLSLATISELQERITNHRSNLELPTDLGMQTPAGQKILAKAVGVLVNHNNLEALELLTAEVPLLKAIIPIFSKALGKHVEAKINKAVVRLVEDAEKVPSFDLDSAIHQEATEIARSTIVDWTKMPPEIFPSVEAALETDNRIIASAHLEVNSRFKAERNRVVKENLILSKQVRDRWRSLTKTIPFAEYLQLRSMLNRSEVRDVSEIWGLHNVRDPEAKEVLRRFDHTFRELTEHTESIADPSEQHEMLSRILTALSGSGGVTDAVKQLASLGENGFVTLTAEHGGSSIEPWGAKNKSFYQKPQQKRPPPRPPARP